MKKLNAIYTIQLIIKVKMGLNLLFCAEQFSGPILKLYYFISVYLLWVDIFFSQNNVLLCRFLYISDPASIPKDTTTQLHPMTTSCACCLTKFIVSYKVNSLLMLVITSLCHSKYCIVLEPLLKMRHHNFHYLEFLLLSFS